MNNPEDFNISFTDEQKETIRKGARLCGLDIQAFIVAATYLTVSKLENGSLSFTPE